MKTEKHIHGQESCHNCRACACAHGHETEAKNPWNKIIWAAVLFAAALAAPDFLWLKLPLYVASYLLCGTEVLLTSFRNIKAGEVFDENFLMALATFGAFAIGEYPEAAAVMLFYQTGERLQELAAGRSRSSIVKLMDLRPDFARVIRQGKEEKINPQDVTPGEITVVLPGERIALDGIIVEGEGHIDASALTGESRPVSALKGKEVLAGCISLDGTLQIRTTKNYQNSAVAKILELAENAANKEVDFSVAWGNAPTHGSEQVSNYLTVTPDSDGSTMATVSCKKAFGDDTIIITVTTREGGYTATCTVLFTGVASGIEITSSTATKKSTSARGEYYELGTRKTYTFDIELTNAFDDVTGNLSVTEIGGSGNMYFGSRYSNDGGYYNYQDVYQQSLGEIAGEFITSATISGNTLTVQTGSSVLENYYSEYAYDEWDNYYAQNAYVVELDDYWNIKDTSDTFNNQNAKYNAENIGSCYFYVKVTDSISGLSETVRLWLVSSVSGVSLSQTEMEF